MTAKDCSTHRAQGLFRREQTSRLSNCASWISAYGSALEFYSMGARTKKKNKHMYRRETSRYEQAEFERCLIMIVIFDI